jgi:hypothetical protein
MPLEDVEVKQLVLDLFKNPSERDKQSLIGASEIGNPCDYCLATRLQGTGGNGGAGLYWLGARLGTAMHETLEKEAAKHVIEPENYRFTALKGARIEEKITLGEIPGYGVIKSKPDLVLPSAGHLLDYKSTKRTKLSGYRLDGVPEQYVIQQSLYAWGLGKQGIRIDRISLVFVNRDGASDSDVQIISWDYDEKVALRAWDRLNRAWKWLQDGGDPATLDSHPECYVCSRILRRV